ncbi:uncharacterized protein [Hetaerina americana]|uniref:uncharacterized protein n=1 Tax=Hetaerina americana TaxID=62018 RepID=UPI003A7F2043
MCDTAEFEVCRLCLNSRGLLINVFGENSELQIMLEKTIEDLIDFKVVQDANHPWLVCSACMDLLTEYRLFKRRCRECLSDFYDRMRKGCNFKTKEWVTNREELPTENQKDIDKDAFAFDTVGSSALNVQDDLIIVKEEAETSSGCSVAPEKDIKLPMNALIQEDENNWCSNVEAKNLDPLEDKRVLLSFNEEVDIKEDCSFDIPQEDKGLGMNLLQEQGRCSTAEVITTIRDEEKDEEIPSISYLTMHDEKHLRIT